MPAHQGTAAPPQRGAHPRRGPSAHRRARLRPHHGPGRGIGYRCRRRPGQALLRQQGSAPCPSRRGAPDELPGGTSGEKAEALLTSLGRRPTGELEASSAVLRCMLKNADADADADDRNRAAGEPQLNQLIEVISTPDAGLLSAIVHGGLDAATHLAADVIAERYLLRLTHLADASPEQIIGLLRPCFQSLTNRPDGSSPPLRLSE